MVLVFQPSTLFVKAAEPDFTALDVFEILIEQPPAGQTRCLHAAERGSDDGKASRSFCLQPACTRCWQGLSPQRPAAK